ncbi:MAG: DinB family protein [Bacteroidetes bacterium]|jgi:hypothetical protein|nr:DinB family protein [Bacteroidota bacterium]
MNSLQESLAILRITRGRIADLLLSLDLEQVNRIPKGWNNNLIWNAAHCVATQQLLTYGLAGLKIPLPGHFVERYRKGTVPQGPVGNDEMEEVLYWLGDSPIQLAADLELKDFGSFARYETSYGYTLHTIGEALAFNNTHEGLHLGYMMALRRAI